MECLKAVHGNREVIGHQEGDGSEYTGREGSHCVDKPERSLRNEIILTSFETGDEPHLEAKPC